MMHYDRVSFQAETCRMGHSTDVALDFQLPLYKKYSSTCKNRLFKIAKNPDDGLSLPEPEPQKNSPGMVNVVSSVVGTRD